MGPGDRVWEGMSSRAVDLGLPHRVRPSRRQREPDTDLVGWSGGRITVSSEYKAKL